jgi:hypothetical protein
MVSLLMNARKMLSPLLYLFAYVSKQFASKKEHDINGHLTAGAALLG